MNVPGFTAGVSLSESGRYRTVGMSIPSASPGREIQYGELRASVQASGVMLQQLPHLFCRPTDCPCQKAACIRGGGMVAPSRQPPCFFTCKRR
jgi:hypothetical protein